MKNKSYKVTALLGDGYAVSSTSCECPLGKFVCHHVTTALLYGYKCVSKSDVKCGWLKNPKTAMKKDMKTMEELFPPSQPDYQTTGPISTKLGTKHPWVMRIQVCSNEGPHPFPR
ncbi:uncharacterized protein LOC144617670 isoform X1 [Crassostrea virginica]